MILSTDEIGSLRFGLACWIEESALKAGRIAKAKLAIHGPTIASEGTDCVHSSPGRCLLMVIWRFLGYTETGYSQIGAAVLLTLDHAQSAWVSVFGLMLDCFALWNRVTPALHLRSFWSGVIVDTGHFPYGPYQALSCTCFSSESIEGRLDTLYD